MVSRILADLPIGLGITEALRIVKNFKNDLPGPDLNQKKKESNEEVKESIKDIPEKSVDTTDAKGDDTKTAEQNAMDNTEPEVKDTKADDKLTGPEMCSCSLGYPHSAYHHQMSNLKKEEE